MERASPQPARANLPLVVCPYNLGRGKFQIGGAGREIAPVAFIGRRQIERYVSG